MWLFEEGKKLNIEFDIVEIRGDYSSLGDSGYQMLMELFEVGGDCLEIVVNNLSIEGIESLM